MGQTCSVPCPCSELCFIKGRVEATRSAVPRSVAALICTIALLSSVGAQPALAQDGSDDEHAVADAFAWGFTGFEVAIGGGLYYLLSRKRSVPPWQHVAISLAPIAVGVGVGALAYQGRWNGEAGRATHGAIWGGIGGIALGSVIDGYIARSRLRIGQWAYTFGFTGAVAAAWLGATQVDPGTELPMWLGAPVMGMTGGMVLGGVTALILSMNRKERLGLRILGLSISSGIAIGLLASSLSNPTPADSGQVAGRGLTGLPQPFMLTVPFTF